VQGKTRYAASNVAVVDVGVEGARQWKRWHLAGMSYEPAVEI
jgi:hypothetical protein